MNLHLAKRLQKLYALARHGVGVFVCMCLGLFVFVLARATATTMGWFMIPWVAHAVLIAYIALALGVWVVFLWLNIQAMQHFLRKTAFYQQGRERSIEVGLDHTDNLINWFMAMQCKEPEVQALFMSRQLHRLVDDQHRKGRGKRKM